MVRCGVSCKCTSHHCSSINTNKRPPSSCHYTVYDLNWNKKNEDSREGYDAWDGEMKTGDLEEDWQDGEKERRGKYSLVILDMSNNLPQKPFHQAHINTTYLPSPLKTRSFDNVPAFLPPFFLQSSCSSCRCLTVPSVQRKKLGRLKVFFFPLLCSLILS